MALYEKPENKFVASFIGNPAMNFFKAEVQKKGVSIGGKTFSLDGISNAEGVEIGIRPEHLKQSTKQKAIISGRIGSHRTPR